MDVFSVLGANCFLIFERCDDSSINRVSLCGDGLFSAVFSILGHVVKDKCEGTSIVTTRF